LATLNALKINIEEYISRKGEFPPNSETGLEEIGTATDAFKLGVIALGTPVNITGGAIEITFSGDASVFNKSQPILTLTRDTEGGWKCTVTKGTSTDSDENFKAILPKGCTLGAGSPT
ncbi:MAG: pilin, partial [Enterovibrio sp.]